MTDQLNTLNGALYYIKAALAPFNAAASDAIDRTHKAWVVFFGIIDDEDLTPEGRLKAFDLAKSFGFDLRRLDAVELVEVLQEAWNAGHLDEDDVWTAIAAQLDAPVAARLDRYRGALDMKVWTEGNGNAYVADFWREHGADDNHSNIIITSDVTGDDVEVGDQPPGTPFATRLDWARDRRVADFDTFLDALIDGDGLAVPDVNDGKRYEWPVEAV